MDTAAHTSYTHACGAYFGLAGRCCAYFILWKTALGFKIRAVGMNRDAARFAGIDERKIFVSVFL